MEKRNKPARKRVTALAASLISGLSLGVAAAAAITFTYPTPVHAQLQAPDADDGQGPSQRLIVKFRDRAGVFGERAVAARAVLQAAAARHGVQLTPLRQIATGGEVVRVQGRRLADAEFKALLMELRGERLVEYVEEDRIMKALVTPNDTRYSEQWDLYETTAGLKLPSAWDITTGSGVVVAVLDTGYRPHADLAGNIVGGYDFIGDTFVSNDGNGRDSDASDPGDWYTTNQCGAGTGSSNSSWHGTHVAGTVAAVTNNGSGVAGVAYGAKVLPIRVLGRCGGYTSDIADGIIWASGGSVSGVPANAYPAKVLNLSLGGGGSCDSTSQAAINAARANGATVVVAAGNENTNASSSSPANCSGVVTVAAVGRSGSRAYYSNYGAVVDVAAPGGDTSTGTSNGILSTLNSGTTTPGADSYAFYQGTSMATPHVAGLAALLYAVKPTITPDQVESTLKTTARAFPGTCSQCGTGIVDAPAAVAAAQGGGTDPEPPTGSVLQNGVPVTGLSGSASSELRYTIVVPSGASGLSIAISGGSGDADLYVKFGSAPTTSSYDCRPYLSGNTESCTFATPSAGTYHVLVRGYSAYSGLSLLGSYSTGGSSGGSCASGYTAYTGSLSGAGVSAYVPGSSGYTSSVSGAHNGRLSGPGSADFDLYLQRRVGSGSWSTVGSGESSSSTESIDYNGTAASYRWRVYSYSGSGSYTLCARRP